MDAFFNGWRRKAGIAMLVVALAICGAWLRSRTIGDAALVAVSNRRFAIASSDSQVLLWSWSEDHLAVALGIGVKPPLLRWGSSPAPLDYYMTEHFQKDATLIIFGGREWLFQSSPWVMPYWSITIPFTLLSAYLIIWKPRKRACPN